MSYETQCKFLEKLDWITHALIEKIDGKMPSKQELYKHLEDKYQDLPPQYHKITTRKWKGEVIVIATYIESIDDEGNDVVSGSFDIPTDFNDEYIQQQVNSWQ